MCDARERRDASMFTKWDKRFDAICGADIRSTNCSPRADSGVKDLLYGTSQCLCDEQPPAAVSAPPGASRLPAEPIWRRDNAVRLTDPSKLLSGNPDASQLPRA